MAPNKSTNTKRCPREKDMAVGRMNVEKTLDAAQWGLSD